MCVSTDARPFTIMKPQAATTSKQSLQTSIASKISNLASKVKLKMKTREKYQDRDDVSAFDCTFQCKERRTPTGNIGPYPFGVFISTEPEERHNSKAEAGMDKMRILLPWKRKEPVIAQYGRSGWYQMNINQEHEPGGPQSSIEDSGLLFSSKHVSNSGITGSSGMSMKSNCIIKDEMETKSVDYKIFWEDLIYIKQIGQGSYGAVYHALWHGSDVAVKVFVGQDFADDMILAFKQEVSLMKRLYHPNILLFMGAVTSPQHLCIVTEFLPRGSLFQILHKNTTRLDRRRRLYMAMDIARGMNYLHHCNPPIVHRDLKSPNLLVNKNWTVKVGDFGLSRIKDQTYLKTNLGKGTPQWMAPELLRNEKADEKSDVYSYGVVLWEIITEKIPWDDLDPMQVIAAVGFMNQRLEIPKHVDPLWVSLIESCWCRLVSLTRIAPQSRPTFQEILYKLKGLQKKFAAEHRR
uniref:probable serine/threonine-protein kinase SIS8 n=1 Tax=Erigeron canadensis TaxID=72917 RepID=UPI001CB90EF7|nr:probable serine/threonine-protein kinase SIS8 [Erigeron canadensis]